ncbi:hypothetical protein SE16_08655 [Ardenticatena maritima]|uniref:Uncharacterized protein n=1 Tax=Ardenticatena maritima TaxID=872965 RepID=A0A0P6Y6V3_9CHLR|nr:hypothetical protein SE16_08655 [Ardenticatena maritima]
MLRCVSLVGIHQKPNIRERFAHKRDKFHILPRRNFEFDTTIAGFHQFFDTFEQQFGFGDQTHHCASWNTLFLSPNVAREGHTRFDGFVRPQGHLDGGFCHGMAAHARQTCHQCFTRFKIFLYRERKQILRQNVPGRRYRFVPVRRRRQGNTFAPYFDVPNFQPQQQCFAGCIGVSRGAEGLDERQLNVIQCRAMNLFHRLLLWAQIGMEM